MVIAKLKAKVLNDEIKTIRVKLT